MSNVKESFYSAIKSLCSFFTSSFTFNKSERATESLPHQYQISQPSQTASASQPKESYNMPGVALKLEAGVTLKLEDRYPNLNLKANDKSLLSGFDFYKGARTDVDHMAKMLDIDKRTLNQISFTKRALKAVGQCKIKLEIPLSKGQHQSVEMTPYQLLTMVEHNDITDRKLLADLAQQMASQLKGVECNGASYITEMIQNKLKD
ncbi:hypothetical protein JQC92_16045 [Shewanella sp. 202IG2-18]|uniref:hypothetical protein n=1 Tax=Parashewanella hymeniacidonis TaxID=2807618 RepID=UPI001960E7AC|nr:hypothetical protein [Parashewanella hymeniacidonis]MBM7073526.1 hypothetical protein [Parashewanella hymeniacidonis]